MATKSTKKIKDKPVVAPKKYLIALCLFVGIILVTIYIFKWYQVFNTEKIKESYLISSGTITNEISSLSELSDVLSETPDEYFLYISYTNDKNIYDMEVNLKKIIQKYELQDKFYYLNIDEIKKNDGYVEEINSALNLNQERVSSIPTILYYKDHSLVPGGIIVKDPNALMQASDFEQMLETMEITKP